MILQPVLDTFAKSHAEMAGALNAARPLAGYPEHNDFARQTRMVDSLRMASVNLLADACRKWLAGDAEGAMYWADYAGKRLGEYEHHNAHLEMLRDD